MKQTPTRETTVGDKPSSVESTTKRRTGENFRFAPGQPGTNSPKRGRGRERNEKLDERFGVPSGLGNSNFAWNERKKWRANSHNKADNRAIKITFARAKKAKRATNKKLNENFVSRLACWSTVCELKNFLRKAPIRCSPRENATDGPPFSRMAPLPSTCYLSPASLSKLIRL